MKNKMKWLLIFLTFIMLIAFVGVTYAVFSKTLAGNKKYILRFSDLELQLDESKTDTSITLEDMIPMKDEEGKANPSYRFSLLNLGNKEIDYVIYIVEDTKDHKTPSEDIRYHYTRDAGKLDITRNIIEKVTEDEKYYLESDSIPGNTTYHYEFQMWLDYDAEEEAMGTEYSIHLEIDSGYDESIPNSPELASGMIPVTYDATRKNWVVADTRKEWYNYDEQNWANAVTVKEGGRDNYIKNFQGTIYDLTENHHDAVTVGSPSYSKEGMILDGYDDGIYFESVLKDLFKSSNTVQIKLKRDNFRSRDVIFGNFDPTNLYNINYEYTPTNLYRVYFQNGKINIYEASKISAPEFVLITYVYDKENSNLTIYENDQLIMTNTNEIYKTYSYDFLNAYIGRDIREKQEGIAEGDTPFAGTVEKVMIYNDVLTFDEIKKNIDTEVGKIGGDDGVVDDHLFLFYDFRDYSKVIDLTENHHNAITVGTPSYSKEGIVLDGIDDGIYLDDMLKDLFKSSNTVQIKLKRNDLHSRDIIFGNFHWPDIAHNINYEYTVDNRYRLHFNNGIIDLNEPSKITSSQFLTVTYVYDKENSKITIYEDDQVILTTQDTRYKEYNYDFVSAYIGRDGRDKTEAITGGIPLSGIIERVMIYNDVLTPDEIKKNMDTEVGKIGGNDGVVDDHLFLFYDFRSAYYQSDERFVVDTTVNMNDTNTMFVWIPRFSYTIKSEDGINYFGKKEVGRATEVSQNLPGAIDIKFIDKDTVEKGSGKYTITKGDSWRTPDSFTFDNKQLSGIWVGKFELTGNLSNACTDDSCDISNLTIKPKETSLREQSASSFFYAIKSMQKLENPYGFTIYQNVVDTHMMKNSEWGVVAYLSQSKYGKYGNKNYDDANKQVKINNCSSFKTGVGATTQNEAESSISCSNSENQYDGQYGMGASTTGNITGIYDMSGGTYEYVMGNFNRTTRGSRFIENLEGLQEKYYDLYKTNDPTTACDGVCFGHALSEVSGWYDDYNYFVNANNPWLLRGGIYADTSHAGVFAFNGHDGSLGSRYSSRVTLIPFKQ